MIKFYFPRYIIRRIHHFKSNRGIHKWLIIVNSLQFRTLHHMPYTRYEFRPLLLWVRNVYNLLNCKNIFFSFIKGAGPLSQPVQVKIQQGVPSQPSNFRTVDIGETAVTLQWNRPSHSSENIVHFELYWNDTYANEQHHQYFKEIFYS